MRPPAVAWRGLRSAMRAVVRQAGRRNRRRRSPSMWPAHPEDAGRKVEDFDWVLIETLRSFRPRVWP